MKKLDVRENIITDERAVPMTIEMLLTFSITALLLSLIALSSQSILNTTTDITIQRELGTIGNDIASKIQDLNTMINIASSSGEIIELSSQVRIPNEVGGSSYTIAMEKGLIKLTPQRNQYIEVKVPLSPEIPITKCSISSVEKTKILKYNRTSGTIYFDKACDPIPDTMPPTIAFLSPANNSELYHIATIKVNASDNVKVVKVEFYANNTLAYVAEYPYIWKWNTERYPPGTYQIKAIAYDRSGNIASDSISYKVVGLPPGNVSNLMADAQNQKYPDIKLTWTKPANSSVASYKIYRSTIPINDSNKDTNATLIENSWFSPVPEARETVSPEIFKITGPVSYIDSSPKILGVKYYYIVTIVNASGVEGPISNLADAIFLSTGTWNSSNLETASFIPTSEDAQKEYTFTPNIPTYATAYEVDVAIGINSYSKKNANDYLHIEIPSLVSDKCTKLDSTGIYWFNSTAYPNNIAYKLRVYIEPKGGFDSISCNYVEVFIKYHS